MPLTNPNELGVLRQNFITDTDSYKGSHFLQYRRDLNGLLAYIESRGGRYGKTVWAGLQGILMATFLTPITKEMVEEAKVLFAGHGVPFPYEGWMRIVDKHKGRLPLKIRAVPEGTVIEVSNVLATVECTDPELLWLTTWVETKLMRVWYPTTVATKSYYCKRVIWETLVKTSDDPLGELPFKLHDFGSRGVSSRESAAIGGGAHLVNFQGSDTVEAIRYMNHYYQCLMSGFSIAAAEHSTIISWRIDRELDAYRNMVAQFAKPDAIFAVVSDSTDLYKVVEEVWAGELHEAIRNSGATCVIRPDSGDPLEVNLEVLGILDRKVGMQKNLKGYKVLPKYFRIIQGDGNKDEDTIGDLLWGLVNRGYSISNIALGMGGGLLQLVNRDTQEFAMKICAASTVEDGWYDTWKDPKTGGGKKSKRGRLDLIQRNGKFQTVREDEAGRGSCLDLIYENGRMVTTYTLDEVRANAGVDFAS